LVHRIERAVGPAVVAVVRIGEGGDYGCNEGALQTKPVCGHNNGDVIETLVYIEGEGAFKVDEVVQQRNDNDKSGQYP